MPNQSVGLQIELTAEVARAVANLQNVNQAFEQMGAEAKKALADASGAIADLGKGTVSINRLSRALDVFRTASLNATDPRQLREYNRNIELLENEIHRLSNEGRNLNTSLNAVNRSASGGANVLTDLSRIASDAPFGFIAISNNLDPLIGGFGRLVTASGGLAGALKALGGALTGGAGLGLAFSVINALIVRHSQNQQKAASAAKATAVEVKTLSDIMKEASGNLAVYNAQAQAEILVVNRLLAIAKDETKSREDRTGALKALKAESKGFLDQLTLETLQTTKATTAIDAYTKSLMDAAIAKGFESELTEIAKAYGIANRETLKAQKSLDEYNNAVKRGNLIAGQSSPKGVLGRISSQRVSADVQEKLNKLTDDYNAAATKSNALLTSLTGTSLQLADVQSRLQLVKVDKSQVSQAESIAKILSLLPDQLRAVDLQAKATAQSFDGLAKDKIKILEGALNKLINLGVDPGSAKIAELTKQIVDLSNAMLGTTPITTKLTFNLSNIINENQKTLTPEELFKLLGLKGGVSENLDLKIGIRPQPTIETKPTLVALQTYWDKFNKDNKNRATTVGAEFNKTFSFIFQSIKLPKELQNIAPAIINFGDQLRAAVGGAAVGLGEAIGNLISGKNGLSGVLSGLLGIMGQFISDFGKSLVTAATLRIIAEKSLLSNPYVALAAGIAAIAAGQVIKNKVPAFATGGFAMGPQLALIGDNPGRKEMIVPSEDFDKLQGGGDFVLTTRLSGQDILLAIQRAGRELKRFN